MKRPLALTIVGVFWFLFGTVCVAGDAVTSHGLKIPDNNWMYLLIGIGLLKGWRICRLLALWASAVVFIFTAFFSFWALPNASRMVFQFPTELTVDDRSHGALPVLAVIGVLLFFLAVSGWSFFVLLRDDVRMVFHKQGRDLLHPKLG